MSRRRPLLAATTLAVVALVAAACQPTKPPPAPPPNVDVVVLGDSIAYGIGCELGDPGQADPNLPRNCSGRPGITAANGWTGSCTISGGTLLLYNSTTTNTPNCHDFRTAWPGGLAALDPEVVILLTGQFEIVDRWAGAPGVQAPERQWASTDPGQDAAAAQAYRGALQDAVNIFKGVGAKVILVNSSYSNAPRPDPIWWEAYPPTSPVAGQPIHNWSTPPPTTYQDTWVAPYALAPYKSGKAKVDRFNAELADFVTDLNDPDVHLFDMWDLFTPQDPDTADREWHPDICPSNPVADPATCPSEAVRVRHPDGGHFLQAGYAFLTDRMLPLIQQLLA